jgi:hypothetical protein
MAQQNITPGSAPILWSSVSDAFDKINANFTELYLTISGGSSGAVDLENLAGNLSPNTSGAFFLGSSDNRWKALYLTTDGIDIGGAVVFSPDGAAVNLPAGSTVGGELIRNPAEASFKNIAVSGQTTVSADDYTDTVTFAGTDINITTNAATDTVTFVNNGVTQLNGTANEIGVSGTGKGNVTLTNLGVTQLVGTAGQIGVSGTLSGGRGQVTLTNLGVTSISAGTGISISPVGGTGAVTITNDLPDTFGFRTIAVVGQSSVVAEVREDTLTLTAGTNIFITTVPGTDTITISSTTSFDLKGSVFGDDSTLLVDAVNGIIPAAVVSGTFTGILKGSVFADDSTQIIDGNTATVYGNIEATTLRTSEEKIALGENAGLNQAYRAVAIGASAGSEDQGTRAVAIGGQAGELRQSNYGVAVGASAAYFEQGASAVAIGDNAGQSSQGDYAIAVGHYAGHNNQSANSIILNASGAILNGAAAGFYVNPVRSTTSSARPVVYDTTTKELFYTSTLEFINSTISTTDSSSITVDVLTTFNSDVVVENDLDVTQRLRVQGSRVINITELKAIVAASTDFAAFKTAIAGLV